MTEIIIDKSALPQDRRECESLRIDLEERLPIQIARLNLTKPQGSSAVKIEVSPGLFSDSYVYSVQYGIANDREFTPLGISMEYNSECLPFPKPSVENL